MKLFDKQHCYNALEIFSQEEDKFGFTKPAQSAQAAQAAQAAILKLHICVRTP